MIEASDSQSARLGVRLNCPSTARPRTWTGPTDQDAIITGALGGRSYTTVVASATITFAFSAADASLPGPCRLRRPSDRVEPVRCGRTRHCFRARSHRHFLDDTLWCMVLITTMASRGHRSAGLDSWRRVATVEMVPETQELLIVVQEPARLCEAVECAPGDVATAVMAPSHGAGHPGRIQWSTGIFGDKANEQFDRTHSAPR